MYNHDKKIRVLVVDDSAFMRNAITKMITSDPDFVVVGTARDGVEAIDKVISLRPDIVTLDIEMPRMNGLEALKVIMDKSPVPVVMLSSLTTEGARETIEALELGALDFIPKNLSDLSINIVKIKDHLLRKLKEIGRKRFVPPKRKAREKVTVIRKSFEGQRKVGLVTIGCSTGGPRALQEIIPRLPADFPVAILISQHMPKSFTGPFAERLNQLSSINVKEAESGEPIKSGTVYIAPGGGHMGLLRRKAIDVRIRLLSDNGESIYKPSVDVMMLSAAEVFPGRVLGVILTGMGNDGLKGIRKIKQDGGRTIAQDEATSVVYGMPKAIVDAGLADKVLPINEIAGEIVNSV